MDGSTRSPRPCCASATGPSSRAPASRRCSTCSTRSAWTSSASRSTPTAPVPAALAAGARRRARRRCSSSRGRRTRPAPPGRPPGPGTWPRVLAARARTSRSSRTTRPATSPPPRALARPAGCPTGPSTSEASPSRTGPTCGWPRSAGRPPILDPLTERRLLGQGWSSRLLQLLLLDLLTDPVGRPPSRRPAPSTPAAAASSPAALRRAGVDVNGGRRHQPLAAGRRRAGRADQPGQRGHRRGRRGGLPPRARPAASAHLRLTVGLVGAGHAEVAASLARAARAGAWGAPR